MLEVRANEIVPNNVHGERFMGQIVSSLTIINCIIYVGTTTYVFVKKLKIKITYSEKIC